MYCCWALLDTCRPHLSLVCTISCHLFSSCALQDCSASVWWPLTPTSLKMVMKRTGAKPGRWAHRCNKAYLGWQDPIRGVQGLAAPALQLLHQAALGVASSRPDAGQHVHELLICLSECITSKHIAQTSQLKYFASLIMQILILHSLASVTIQISICSDSSFRFRT